MRFNKGEVVQVLDALQSNNIAIGERFTFLIENKVTQENTEFEKLTLKRKYRLNKRLINKIYDYLEKPVN